MFHLSFHIQVTEFTTFSKAKPTIHLCERACRVSVLVYILVRPKLKNHLKQTQGFYRVSIEPINVSSVSADTKSDGFPAPVGHEDQWEPEICLRNPEKIPLQKDQKSKSKEHNFKKKRKTLEENKTPLQK